MTMMSPAVGKLLAAIVEEVLKNTHKPEDLRAWLKALAFAMLGGFIAAFVTGLSDYSAVIMGDSHAWERLFHIGVGGAVGSGWTYLKNPVRNQPVKEQDEPEDKDT
jgi:hypothetical protein